MKILPLILRPAPQIKDYEHQWVNQRAFSGQRRCVYYASWKDEHSTNSSRNVPDPYPSEVPQAPPTGPSTAGGGRLRRRRMENVSRQETVVSFLRILPDEQGAGWGRADGTSGPLKGCSEPLAMWRRNKRNRFCHSSAWFLLRPGRWVSSLCLQWIPAPGISNQSQAHWCPTATSSIHQLKRWLSQNTTKVAH